ncbi:hypothetical protein [Cryobacterium lyxosi]|uniref:Uncharacterized protein n=1 Tax=Cryobacterium lyxosi TaxID=1259228 RepID=A0A4R8ZDP4_9MICO|nr:hypothetical protein [Cryobacterium lyxosi]TFD24533.1 hypothetical protein E3T27_12890 [Cryobacterium lyxosi]
MNSYVSHTSESTIRPNGYISQTMSRVVMGSGYVSGTAQHRDAGEYISHPTVTSPVRAVQSQMAGSKHLAAAA